MRFLLFGLLGLATVSAHAQPPIETAAGKAPGRALLIDGFAIDYDGPVLDPSVSVRTLGGARRSSLVWTLVPAAAGLAVMIAADGSPEAGEGSDSTGGSDALATAGFLLMSAGLIVGPSAGHFYLGDGRRAWIGLGIRGGGVGVGALATAIGGGDGYNEFDDVGKILLFSSIAVVAGGIYSFATLDDSARERGIVLAPVLQADGGTGIALSMRF